MTESTKLQIVAARCAASLSVKMEVLLRHTEHAIPHRDRQYIKDVGTLAKTVSMFYGEMDHYPESEFSFVRPEMDYLFDIYNYFVETEEVSIASLHTLREQLYSLITFYTKTFDESGKKRRTWRSLFSV